MKKHAPSHITDTDEVNRLLLAALREPSCHDSLVLEADKSLKTDVDRDDRPSEFLGRWSQDTPEGRLHRVAILRDIDLEPMGFDEYYLAEQDAIAVWCDQAKAWDSVQDAKRTARAEIDG